MASQAGQFNVQEFTDLGDPLIGGRLYTYAYGTTTQKNAFTDPAGAVPHTYTSDGMGGQYIALNARGELPAPLYLGSGPYDLALKTAAGATIWTRRAQATLIASNIVPVQLASATTVDIGGQGVTSIEVTGNTDISSFGTNYAGPIFVRFSGSLALIHNSVTLSIPGGTNAAINPGDIVIASGNSNSNGWNVLVLSQSDFAKAGINVDITEANALTEAPNLRGLGNNTSTIYTTAGTSTAYTIAPTPAIAAYAVGQSFVVNFNAASGASPTLQISGIATPPNLVRAVGDGTYANIAANAIPANHRSRVTLISTTQALIEEMPAPFSMIRVHTPPGGASGYGSTNTRFRRFTTTVTNQGSDITYADSVTLGGLFTVNVPGRYAISYTDQFAAGDYLSITLNDTVPTGVPLVGEILASDSIAGANVSANCSWTGELPAGALIRARTQNGTSSGSQTQYGQFTISRVG